MTERELIELLNEIKILLDLDEIDMAKDRIDTIIQSYSQPNGGDRVVNENEKTKDICPKCKTPFHFAMGALFCPKQDCDFTK